MKIDINKLRKDLREYYGTAAANGFPAAIIDLENLEKLSDREILETAIMRKVELEKYVDQ